MNSPGPTLSPRDWQWQVHAH
ncbi:hypothetical protein QR98_0090460, partial [Sarcoptes scabiei]